MTTMHEYRTVKDMAKDLAGNWKKFTCFGWHEKPADCDRRAIVYTHNRDSGLLDKSNASVIEKALAPFTKGEYPSVRREVHSHWACGWVEGYSIRVYDRKGEVTKAFQVYADLMLRLQDYPVLDDSDYSNRELEATRDNIASELKYMNRRGSFKPFTDDTAEEVLRWLWDNNASAVENSDDQGGYPSGEELTEALRALGY